MSNQWAFKGRPTGPEVELLIKNIPPDTLKPGTVIEYSTIESIIKTSIMDSRFRTVSNAWRKRLYQNYNIAFDAASGLGFVVLGNSARTSKGVKKISGGIKKISYGGDILQRTPEEGLSEEDKRSRTAHLNIAGTLKALFNCEKKKLRYNVPTIENRTN